MHQISKTLSVIVPTLGRETEVVRLLKSLERQSFQDFEVIIVDQNQDDRVAKAISIRAWKFPVQHYRTPHQRGASRARNLGWRRARGQILLFADDDCWYPATLFGQAVSTFGTTVTDILGGRPADETGRSIIGSYLKTPQSIDRENVWAASIEWMLFFRRSVLERLNGFDDGIGIGASTPWQSSEDKDILLRALNADFKCYYDPSLWGHHPELSAITPGEALRRKARAYGRGMGFVLRKHNYGLLSAAYYIARPTAAACVFALKGKWSRMFYYANVASGRLEGWRQNV